jgi:RNA polymerase sigma-70 factor (ECF subfamily)
VRYLCAWWKNWIHFGPADDRNLVTDVYRNNGQATHLPLEEALAVSIDGDRVLSQRVDRRLSADCLAAALEHLTGEQRQVVLFKFIEDLDNAQVARLLSKSEGAIKSLQHRALQALRRALEKERCYEA